MSYELIVPQGGKGWSFFAYAAILDRIWSEIQSEENLAPIIIAGLKELRSFPEYREATLLLLEEIDITGTSRFDDLMRKEISELSNSLFGIAND